MWQGVGQPGNVWNNFANLKGLQRGDSNGQELWAPALPLLWDHGQVTSFL